MNAKKPQPESRPAPITRPGEPEPGKSGNLLAELRGGVEPGGGDAVPPPPRPRRRISPSNVIFGTVIAVSVGALYAMRLYGMSSGLTFATVPIDYELGGPSDRVRAEQARILRDLARSTEPLRVVHERLNKNPFTLDTEIQAVVGPGSLGPTPDELAALAARSRDEKVAQTLQTLKLNGVMLGRIPLARINDATYREGDTIADCFVIKAIHERSVDLEVDGKVFALSMTEPETRRRP